MSTERRTGIIDLWITPKIARMKHEREIEGKVVFWAHILKLFRFVNAGVVVI